MAFTDFTSKQLQDLLELVREKESLHARLAKIDAELEQLDGAPAARAQRGSLKQPKRTKKPIKEAILEELTQAGPEGLKVKEIAQRAGIKEGSTSVWLYTSGKSVAGLKKIAPGRYSYQPDRK
jgi:hypothetical protein